MRWCEPPFSFHAHWCSIQWVLQPEQVEGHQVWSVKLSKKGNFKKFPAAFQQNGLLLPLSFLPMGKRKQSFCLIEMVSRTLLPPLRSLKWRGRLRLTFLTWLFWICLVQAMLRGDLQNTQSWPSTYLTTAVSDNIDCVQNRKLSSFLLNFAVMPKAHPPSS